MSKIFSVFSNMLHRPDIIQNLTPVPKHRPDIVQNLTPVPKHRPDIIQNLTPVPKHRASFFYDFLHGKDLMQGKLFQRCTHLLYCSVLPLGGNVNTRRMSKPDMGSIFQINNQWNILVIGNYYANYQNYQNSMLLTFSDTKRTLMRHLFLFTNSARRELVSICTQSICNCN